MSNPEHTPRRFVTGATRDTEKDKYDFEGFLSPLVLQAYGKYMHKHRLQSNGELRASDNWQKHFGEKHFDVCIKSLWRHFIDLWLEHRGFLSREGIEDALMGILFNTMAYADKFLKDKIKDEVTIDVFDYDERRNESI